MRLKPEILVGKAELSDNLVEQMKLALERHELVKVRFTPVDKEKRKIWANELARQTDAELCGQTGHTAIYYRQNADPEKRLIEW